MILFGLNSLARTPRRRCDRHFVAFGSGPSPDGFSIRSVSQELPMGDLLILLPFVHVSTGIFLYRRALPPRLGLNKSPFSQANINA